MDDVLERIDVKVDVEKVQSVIIEGGRGEKIALVKLKKCEHNI